MEKKTGDQHPSRHAAPFCEALLTWFHAEGKDYPWRQTTDPWAILVSEIMLQQTTVASVIANRRFEKFLAEFPDLQSIAAAEEEQLLRAWEGLGYYNRVRNLQKTARSVLEDYDGSFPQSAKELEALPGLGPYTAGAVSSFAFDQAAPIVDGNIARVLTRLFDFHQPIDSTAGRQQLWTWAAELLDPQHPRLFNSAIMELGQTICRTGEPKCLLCPVRHFCQTTSPATLPVKKPRRKTIEIQEHALWIVQDDQILLAQEDGSRRKGFWRLPLRSCEETAHLTPITRHQYTITHHRVTLLVYQLTPSDTLARPHSNESFHLINSLPTLPLTSPTRKILTTLL